MFNKDVTVIARLPHGAFGDFRDVPSRQDQTYKKGFGIKSLKAALKYANTTAREYREGHGRCAVYSVKIQVGGTVYSRDFIEEVVEYAGGSGIFAKTKINNMADFARIAKEVRDINTEVQRDMKAESDRLDAEFYAMVAADL